MISASIEVKGPQRDLHSGNEGGKVWCMALLPEVELSLNKHTYRHYTDLFQTSMSVRPYTFAAACLHAWS